MQASILALLAAGISWLSMASSAHAWTRISIYSDATLSDCTLSDTSPGVRSIYVAARNADCATGARFRVAESAGFTGVWINETSPFVPVGSSRNDIAIGFGTARFGTFLILTMNYQLVGTSTCSQVSIAPPPGFSEPSCTGCLFGPDYCFGYDPLYVNCDNPGACNPLATESTTWGKVKALYRN